MNTEAAAHPLVSVVVPAFNAARYLAATLDSVLAQTRRELELIVVDDGSTDDTAGIAREYAARDARVRYTRQENRNLGPARNTGIRLAVGEWVAFIDADDLWLPDKLALQVAALEAQQADVVYTDAFYFSDEPGASLPVGVFGDDPGRWEGREMFARCLRRNTIPVSSVLLRKRWLDRVGGFSEDPGVRGVEDWDLWLSLSARGAVFFGMAERLTRYRTHAGQMSGRWLAMRDSTLRVLDKHAAAMEVPAAVTAGIRRTVQAATVRALIETGQYQDARREQRVLDAMDAPWRRRLMEAVKYRVKLHARQWLGWTLRNPVK